MSHEENFNQWPPEGFEDVDTSSEVVDLTSEGDNDEDIRRFGGKPDSLITDEARSAFPDVNPDDPEAFDTAFGSNPVSSEALESILDGVLGSDSSFNTTMGGAREGGLAGLLNESVPDSPPNEDDIRGYVGQFPIDMPMIDEIAPELQKPEEPEEQ